MTPTRSVSMRAAFCAAVALIATGCDQKHPAQSTGQAIDRAADTAGQKIDRAGKEVATATKDVAAKTANVVDDAALTAKVKAALFAEPGLKTLQIDVETHDAVVTLAGSVDSDVLHKRAVEIAGAMSGVSQVVDKLVVKS
jgi:hyperosmotically inducible protein